MRLSFQELRGGEKRREEKWDLFKIRKIFRKRYGTVFVRFGTPISLKRYLGKNNVKMLPESVERRRELYQRAADDVQRAIAVTPSSLVAAALLSHIDRSISRSKVIETSELYLKILEDLKADFHLKGEDVWAALLRSLDLFTQDGVVRKGVEIDREDLSYFVPLEKRIHLEFSKNMMVAHLAPISLYAWAARASQRNRSVSPYQVFSLLFHLLRYEFFLPVEHPMQWYKLGHAKLEDLPDEGVQTLCHLTLSTLEGFLVGSSYILRGMQDEQVKEKGLVREMIR